MVLKLNFEFNISITIWNVNVLFDGGFKKMVFFDSHLFCIPLTLNFKFNSSITIWNANILFDERLEIDGIFLPLNFFICS